MESQTPESFAAWVPWASKREKAGFSQLKPPLCSKEARGDLKGKGNRVTQFLAEVMSIAPADDTRSMAEG